MADEPNHSDGMSDFDMLLMFGFMAAGAFAMGIAFMVIHPIVEFVLHLVWPVVRLVAGVFGLVVHVLAPWLDWMARLYGGGSRGFALSCATASLVVILLCGLYAKRLFKHPSSNTQ